MRVHRYLFRLFWAQVDAITGLNGSYVNPANPYILTMDSNYNLTAIFSEKPIQCRLHVEVNGSGVTNTTGDTLWDAGTTVNVLATANQGWKLSHWLLNDANSGTINPYSLKINDDYNLTAVFTPTPPVQVQLIFKLSAQDSLTPLATPCTIVVQLECLRLLTRMGLSFGS